VVVRAYHPLVGLLGSSKLRPSSQKHLIRGQALVQAAVLCSDACTPTGLARPDRCPSQAWPARACPGLVPHLWLQAVPHSTRQKRGRLPARGWFAGCERWSMCP
jgi:hypothetical protein